MISNKQRTALVAVAVLVLAVAGPILADTKHRHSGGGTDIGAGTDTGGRDIGGAGGDTAGRLTMRKMD